MERTSLVVVTLALLAASLAVGCADESARPTPALACDAVAAEGVLVGDCPLAAARLLPRVRVDGTWQGAGADGACLAEGARLSCPTATGTVFLESEPLGPGVRVRVCFSAQSPVRIESLEAAGSASVMGATQWLSNGYQSWSQTGMLAIADAPDDASLTEALQARGDVEVVRTGETHSWELTMVGGGEGVFVAGALASGVFKPWVSIHRGDPLAVRLGSGGTGESVAVSAGEERCGEPFFVAGGADLDRFLSAYSAALPARASGARAEAGWNSWYELWDTVDETAVRDNASLARTVLEPAVPAEPPLRIVVDDGWQLLWGEWTPNDKFPSGLDGLAADLRADGFETGVWLAPLLVDDDSSLVADNPDWFVADAQYRHTKNGPMRILDVTHPQAAAHLGDFIARIVSWGYSLLKIDFLFAGTYEGGRFEDVTGMQAYDRALSIIRQAAGEDVILLAVGAPALASLPHVDAWRVGGDIALEPFGTSWSFVVNQARSIAGRYPICAATLCDADPALLRMLPDNEVEVGVWVAAFGGGAFFLSDDLRMLPEERRGWALDRSAVDAGLSGAPSVPEEPFVAEPPDHLASAIEDHLVRDGGTSHVLPRVWRLPDGGRVAINETDEPLRLESVEIAPRAAQPLL